MNPTQQLRNLGQSLWLDNITRDLLNNGTLERYIAELAITGLTSNPTIFVDNTRTLDEFVRAGVNLGALAAQLQDEGATSFVKSWNDLLNVISSKTAALQQAA